MKKTQTGPRAYRLEVAGRKGQEVSCRLGGRIALDNAYEVLGDFRELLAQMSPAKLTVDLDGIDYLDSSGALALLTLQSEAQRQNLPVTLVNATPEARRIMDLIDLKAIEAPPLRQEVELNLIEQLGQGAVRLVEEAYKLLSFFGELLTSLAGCLFRPRQVRWAEVLAYMYRTGVEALPILGLMSLLMGLVVAFMSSFQLQQFGAVIYVADLVGIGFVRELGSLLTGILISGRSGSAFAAEIGTMQVNEEVDALAVMGFEPMRFLAVPKVLATMMVMPVLTIYCMFFGLLGGLIVGVSILDITTYAYVNETRKALSLSNFYYSLFKSVVYAVIIAGIGCQRGFQVRGGAQEVGTATTSAVVTSLFVVIVASSIFSIVQNYLK
jgi:phospholipid/cholesterol/gamma-HCH transport system permease protein|uniref:MlaE family lipid ABC transporter permease subunit n=1 Tax=Desulfobacca acetoxidans TaxID=60893 RepID=A0A7C3Z4X0_9BACT